jgi:tetratricopeptide (TPR) repeat protein
MGLFDFLAKPKVRGIIQFLKLEDWYNSLTPEQQRKLKEYSGKGEDLVKGDIFYSSQTQKHFFWTTAVNAINRKDYEFAIFLAENGLTAQGSLADQHFIYNVFIEAYERQHDYENAKKYCLAELEEFSKIGSALKKDFDEELPPIIPCRDTLIRIVVNIEKDYDEGERLFNLFVQKGLLTQEEAQDRLKNLKIDKMHSEAKKLLDKGKFVEAKPILDTIIDMDESQAGDIYKMLGNYFLKNQREEEALEYFQKSMTANPLISGVERKLQKLSRKLGVKVESHKKDALNILQDKEKAANEWWAKRDLANEYVKIKQYDHAWRLFNEAILLSVKEGMPCDTIYPHMAKMLEKENRYKDALFHYLLAYRELLQGGRNEPPKYVSQSIDRCLKKLGLKNLSHKNLYEFVKKEMDPSRIRASIDELFEQK